MHNFVYHNPVKIIFGKNTIVELASNLPQGATILLAYGGGSIKCNGVYEQVVKMLSGRKVIEFSGIEVNPEYDTLIKAATICREQQVDFILAVGGGSVIDGCKFIALASHYQGDAWDILTTQDYQVNKVIPLGVVLTLPATGSEMNGNSVISRRSIDAKLSFNSPLVYPQFSILDPDLTNSLPVRQLRNGIIDPFIHVTEQYLTTDINSQIQDGFAEAVLKTLVRVGKPIVNGDKDYDLRANWMWAATNALNGIVGLGVDHDWATHMIGHELTAHYGLDHAQTLALVAPQVWRYQKAAKLDKLVKFARNVWGLENQDAEVVSEQAIIMTEEFFHSLGVATRFSGYAINVDAQLIADNLAKHGQYPLGENLAIDADAAKQILMMAQ